MIMGNVFIPLMIILIVKIKYNFYRFKIHYLIIHGYKKKNYRTQHSSTPAMGIHIFRLLMVSLIHNHNPPNGSNYCPEKNFCLLIYYI